MDAREYGERTGWAHGAPHTPGSDPEPPPIPPPRGWHTRAYVLAPIVGFAVG